MAENPKIREGMGRMVEGLVREGMAPDKAASIARDAAIRTDKRLSGDKNWRKPYGSND